MSKGVMVFGTFDLLHDGHVFFLKQAKQYGEKLIAVVARDSVVEKLKNKKSIQNEKERIEAVRGSGYIDEVVLGDEKQGSYEVIKKHKPDVICLGYDQKELMDDLRSVIESGILLPISLIQLDSYMPEVFHSSLIRKGNNEL